MRRGLLDDPSTPYKKLCEALTPGKTVIEDKTKSMDLSALLKGKVDVPTVASFSPAFFCAVYNYYAKQYSQPLLTNDEAHLMKDNDDLVAAINKLKKSDITPRISEVKTIASLNELLGHNLIIGEILHNTVSPKKFLIENMQALKDTGCNTLYFEHIPYDVMQVLFDKFNQTGEMDIKLKRQLASMDRGHGDHPAYNPVDKATIKTQRDQFYEEWQKYNFTAVVVAAQKAGIRIVAIDIADIYKTQSSNKAGGKNALNRVITGDYSFANIIQHDQDTHPGNGKWIALIGAAHVEGLERLLNTNVTTVLVGDSEKSCVELNCRDKNIPNTYSLKLKHLPKSDVVIRLPVGAEMPILKQDLRSTVVSKL